MYYLGLILRRVYCSKSILLLTAKVGEWGHPNIHRMATTKSVLSANLVLHRTIERIHVGKKYGDIPRGIFVVRGENVVLLGEIVSDFL